VNVSALAVHVGEAHCASKAGLSQMTKALAMEHLHSGLRINAIPPGGLATPVGARVIPPEDADMSVVGCYRPLRGLIEVADMIISLTSPAAIGFLGTDTNLR
jgi:NAD(P)-dependent dehydrogenase (short-subunit alcohol dehydrogenase family)